MFFPHVVGTFGKVWDTHRHVREVSSALTFFASSGPVLPDLPVFVPWLGMVCGARSSQPQGLPVAGQILPSAVVVVW